MELSAGKRNVPQCTFSSPGLACRACVNAVRSRHSHAPPCRREKSKMGFLGTSRLLLLLLSAWFMISREKRTDKETQDCGDSPPHPTPVVMAQLQVGINNVARAILGSKCEKVRVEDLVKEAGLFSINKMIIYSIAMECWRALSLPDVPNGPLNPLGRILSPHPNSSSRSAPHTRTASTGCLPPPAKHQVPTFIWSAYTCWNASPALRSAPNVSAAKRAAIELADSAPF